MPNFSIFAPGETAPSDATFALCLEPGAFGNGSHETTVGLLAALAALPALAKAKVLDLGSGSGILAIAALKLGAAGALCVDLNPESVAIARRNCTHNGVAERARHQVGDLAGVDERDFDLVLVNLHGELLADLAPELLVRTRPGGSLLLSGLLRDDADAVTRCFERAGAVLVSRQPLQRFVVLQLRRAV